jgi:hypothetical protein
MTEETTKPTESSELAELFSALAKAQNDMSVAQNKSNNPFFKSKYSDFTTIVKASRPALSTHGLAIMQRVLPNDKGQQFLHTRLCHSSGQWVESIMHINPSKADVQSLASYITYLKRYSYASLVGVVTSDDDDGESSLSEDEKKERETPKPPPKISKDQLILLNQLLINTPDLVEVILKHFSISKLSDLSVAQYEKCINKIKQVKESSE